MEVPPVRFAQARGARLAYQQFGAGPDVVAIPPMAQNIEVAWEWPDIRTMLERLGSFCRYLHFDKRGTGASDRRGVGGIDERVEDLRAVMDDAGVERAHLLGASEGGPMALLFAFTYPHRVSSVTLVGSGASEYPPDMTAEQRATQEDLHRRFAAVWGTPDSPLVDGFAPSLADDPAFRRWHQRYERLSATPESLLDLLDLTFEMDVREILPEVAVPTLVIHRTGDRIVPVERGREVAAAVPGARLVEQVGTDHFPYAGDMAGWLAEFQRFVTGEEPDESRTAAVSPSATPGRHRVRVTVLGRFAVEVDGARVPTSAWGTRLSRQLLKRLVVARGWPVRRDELVELLWPGETDSSRLGPRLSVQLSTVRRVLGGGVIADRETVRLDLDEVWSDLEDLHQGVGRGQVMAAYGGELLPDDVDAAWTAGPRAEARIRFLRAAAERLRTLEENGACDELVDVARHVLTRDPWDATAHRAVVVGLLEVGHVGEAARAHGAWSDAMAELDLPAPPPLDTLGR